MPDKKPEATPPGVTGAEEDPIQQPAANEAPKSTPRQDSMEEIIKNQRQERQDTIAKAVEEERAPASDLVPDEDPPAEDPPAEDPPEEDPPAEDPLEEDPPEEDPPAEDPDPMVTVKIDGESRDVPESEIREAGIRTFQKESAADKRLEEATRLQQQAEKLLQQAADKQSLLPSPSETPDAEELSAAVAKVTAAIYSGEEEDAQTALQELMAATTAPRAQEPTVTSEDISQMVQESVTQAESRRELVGAQKQFEIDFPDVNSDPDLRELANIKTIAILRDHPDWTPSQVITQAGEEVMKKINGGASKKVSSDSLEGRRQAKRSATPPARAASRVPKKPEEKPKTRKDVVAEIQARRIA